MQLVMNGSTKKWSGFKVFFYLTGSLILPYSVFAYSNANLWMIEFNPVDYVLKPFMAIPFAFLLLKSLISWTSYACKLLLLAQRNTVFRYIAASSVLTFLIYSLVNHYYYHLSFNPVDFIIKPFLIIPAACLLLPLLAEWAGLAIHFRKMLGLRIEHSGGKLSLKLIEKPLPIYIVDEDHFTGAHTNHRLIVDMRIKDQRHLPLAETMEIIKLTHFQHPVNIPDLAEKANQIIKDTAMKNKPITFIVDSQKNRSRTISKIWLRLIRNPRSRSATSDIDAILQLVY